MDKAARWKEVQLASSGEPDNEEYSAIQSQVILVAGLIAEMKLEGFLQLITRAHSTGMIMNPTLYRKAMGPLDRVERLASAARAFQKVVHESMQDEVKNEVF